MSVHLRWRQVDPADLGAITTLHASALAVDGGSPFAAADWLPRRWYIDGVDASLAAFCGSELIGVCAKTPGSVRWVTMEDTWPGRARAPRARCRRQAAGLRA